MDLKKILAKVAKGEDLTDTEKDFLTKYDPDNDGRIPKSRLDQEIDAKKAAKKQADELQQQLDEQKAKIEALENGDLTESQKLQKANEKLQKQIDDLTKERDSFKTETESMKFKAAVSKIAAEHNFTDASYLEYLVGKEKDLKLDDKDAVKAFADKLREASPKLFKVEASPGGGSNPNDKKGQNREQEFAEAKKNGNIGNMLKSAPTTDIKTQ